MVDMATKWVDCNCGIHLFKANWKQKDPLIHKVNFSTGLLDNNCLVSRQFMEHLSLCGIYLIKCFVQFNKIHYTRTFIMTDSKSSLLLPILSVTYYDIIMSG